MKKTLLFSAVAVAAFGAQADDVVYDFYKIAPEVCVFVTEEGATSGANYDFIDKYGAAANFGGTQLTLGSKEEGWHGDTSKMIDLTDGAVVDAANADYTHTLIGWGEKGPSRTTLMGGWEQSLDKVDNDYQSATEADFVETAQALAFLRNGNSASREDTYLQIPAVQGPCDIEIYAGTPLGKYATQLEVTVTPVVNGEAQATENIIKADAKAKRMYKLTYNYAGTDNACFRFGCNKSELYLHHIIVKSAGAGVENVALDGAAENAPIYNTLGVQVDENYKGLVIKGGKKYIQK